MNNAQQATLPAGLIARPLYALDQPLPLWRAGATMSAAARGADRNAPHDLGAPGRAPDYLLGAVAIVLMQAVMLWLIL